MKKENNTNTKKVTKKKFNMHNFILKLITIIASIGFFISACAIDSEPLIFIIVCYICSGWILLFAYANKEKIKKIK